MDISQHKAKLQKAVNQLTKAHDNLSEVLEDPKATNDDVREMAINICAALNALYEIQGG